MSSFSNSSQSTELVLSKHMCMGSYPQEHHQRGPSAHLWEKLTFPRQPVPEAAQLGTGGAPQPLPYPCYNADWLDIFQGLHRSHSRREFMSTKAHGVQKTPLTEVRFISGSHNPTTLPSAVFPELCGQQLRFPWFVIGFSWLFNCLIDMSLYLIRDILYY